MRRPGWRNNLEVLETLDDRHDLMPSAAWIPHGAPHSPHPRRCLAQTTAVNFERCRTEDMLGDVVDMALEVIVVRWSGRGK